jgi:hypothetical protein
LVDPDLPSERRSDIVKRAAHYNNHPSGIEAITLVRHMGFQLGNTFKYVFRRDGKEPVRSLKSALYYLDDYANNPEYYIALSVRVRINYNLMLVSEPDQLAREFYAYFADMFNDAKWDVLPKVRHALLQLIARAEEEAA